VGSSRWKKTRATVKARDGACVACGSTADLEVHHLTPARAADDPFDVDDLVTLCRRCHAQADAARRRISR
jgi:5-methylcytosine-specific restriction endonuclease McrA